MVRCMFEVDQDIIDRMRSHCPKWEVCLTGNLHYSCKVTEYDGEHLIVAPSEKATVQHCPRNVHVDSTCVCLCPIRKEIYRKYGK